MKHISDTRSYYQGVIWALMTFYKDEMITKEEAFEELFLVLIHMETQWKGQK